jgi:hypothetical protein
MHAALVYSLLESARVARNLTSHPSFLPSPPRTVPFPLNPPANKSLRERLHGAAESVEDAFGNVVQGLVPAAVVMGVQAREAHLRRHITE